MSVLVDALAADLDELGATVRTRVRARRLTTDGTTWRVVVEEPAAEEPIEGEETTQEAELAADAVIVATSEHRARELLAGAVPALAAADAAPAPRSRSSVCCSTRPRCAPRPGAPACSRCRTATRRRRSRIPRRSGPGCGRPPATGRSSASRSVPRGAGGDGGAGRRGRGRPRPPGGLGPPGVPLTADQVVAGHRGASCRRSRRRSSGRESAARRVMLCRRFPVWPRWGPGWPAPGSRRSCRTPRRKPSACVAPSSGTECARGVRECAPGLRVNPLID